MLVLVRELVEKLGGQGCHARTEGTHAPWREVCLEQGAHVTIEAVIGWLDAGQPDPDTAADRISQAIHGVIEAVRPAGD